MSVRERGAGLDIVGTKRRNSTSLWSGATTVCAFGIVGDCGSVCICVIVGPYVSESM